MTACPRCRTALRFVGDGAACDTCGGAWLTSSIEAAIERALAGAAGPGAAAPADAAGEARAPSCCPRCGEVMRRVVHHAVPLDECAGHGVWYDRGELALVVAQVRRLRWRDQVAALASPPAPHATIIDDPLREFGSPAQDALLTVGSVVLDAGVGSGLAAVLDLLADLVDGVG